MWNKTTEKTHRNLSVGRMNISKSSFVHFTCPFVISMEKKRPNNQTGCCWISIVCFYLIYLFYVLFLLIFLCLSKTIENLTCNVCSKGNLDKFGETCRVWKTFTRMRMMRWKFQKMNPWKKLVVNVHVMICWGNENGTFFIFFCCFCFSIKEEVSKLMKDEEKAFFSRNKSHLFRMSFKEIFYDFFCVGIDVKRNDGDKMIRKQM